MFWSRLPLARFGRIAEALVGSADGSYAGAYRARNLAPTDTLLTKFDDLVGVENRPRSADGLPAPGSMLPGVRRRRPRALRSVLALVVNVLA